MSEPNKPKKPKKPKRPEKPKKSYGYKSKLPKRVKPQYFRSPHKDKNDNLSKQWRKEVFKRDGYKCQHPCCPKTTHKINAHHIIKHSSNVFLRNMVNNGITLCVDCHKRIYGQEEAHAGLFMSIIMNKLREKLASQGETPENTDSLDFDVGDESTEVFE